MTTPVEIRRKVVEAVEAGKLPVGGPSDAAASDLLDDVSADYWKRWSAVAAERIKAQAASARCSRCWGEL